MVATATLAVTALGLSPAASADETAEVAAAGCTSGARSLSLPGARVYPEQGNGGYQSVHTDLHLNYDTVTNRFLPGTHADLAVRTTQCLTDFSFDFETRNDLTAVGTGPDMTVSSVAINGQPATFTFKQPTYPGDPNGWDDPDPAAHAVSNVNPVSSSNPNPPACSPTVSGNAQNGQQCPATKLVISPASPIPDGQTITVTVNYTGRPGIHRDGDGSTEGWFRDSTPGGEGGFVTTEPIGNMAWMPLNNHPSAKPTYDVYDTTNVGKTAIGPGEIVGFTPPRAAVGQEVPVPPTSVNAPDDNFPDGSWTWHWHSPEPIASYLVGNSIGSYDLVARTGDDGIQYFQAQASSISAARKATNKIAMNSQEDLTTFSTAFNGPFPFTTDGVVVGAPSASFEEEMQSKITFAGGTIGGSNGTSLSTFQHENVHQWFGDNVSESQYNLTFWKEGFAVLGEYLCAARYTSGSCTQTGTPSSATQFETSLVNRFNGTGNYGSASASFWTSAPSNPTVGNLFSTASTYTRPATGYLALWQTLGRDRMIAAMKDIQSTYGGSSITEPQLLAVFHKWLPVRSPSCGARLNQFATEWWDTAYPTGGSGTSNKPKVTGPGLNGTGFVCGDVSPAAPTGRDGWYTGDVSVTWQGFGAQAFTKTGCDSGAVEEGVVTRSCSVTTTTMPVLTSGAVSETIKHDSRRPVVSYTGNAGAYTVDQTVSISCSASDLQPGSGLDSDTCQDLTAPAWQLGLGSRTLTASAEDVAGNRGSGSTTFTVSVTFGSLENLVAQFSTKADVTKGLNDKVAAASSAKNGAARNSQLDAFANQVRAQIGKALTAGQATVLIQLSDSLR